MWIALTVQIVTLVVIYINILSGWCMQLAVCWRWYLLTLLLLHCTAGWVTPSIFVAFACAFMLGIGDAIIVILAYSMFGRIFKGGDASVFALMFFSKSAAAGVAFSYSSWFPLVPLVFMLAILNVPAGICFQVWLPHAASAVVVPVCSRHVRHVPDRRQRDTALGKPSQRG